MLVDFCVKNFKSFDDKQIFSLLKDKGDENLDNTFIVGKKQKLQLLMLCCYLRSKCKWQK